METADASDAELLRAYRAGSAAAFARLYDRHDRASFDFVRRMMGFADDAEAEDLHQEVWIAVARAADSFDEAKSRFATWLFTIARNKVMDRFRRTSGVVHLGGESGELALEELAGDAALSPEHIAENAQLAAAIVKEVQALPFVQRETFVLFAQSELALEEVAQITGVGLETAKSRLRYARRALRSRLAGWTTRHG
jgi:RNA polymerase sigma-70 factor (ECF subfamily)